jgi:hypothetical protein
VSWKRAFTLVALIAVQSLTAFAQGTFNMIWYDGVHAISVWSTSSNPYGDRGLLLGSEYSAQAYMGPVGSSEFSLSPVAGSLVAFDLNGTTSAGKTAADGSGQFYAASSVVTGLPLGNAAIQIRVWYNGGKYATYEAAQGWARNTGRSPVMTISLKAAIDPTVQSLTDIGMPPFTIGILTSPGEINITTIQATNGTVTINFHENGHPLWDFDVLASENVSGPYMPVNAVITYQNNFDWQAALSTTNSTQFYQIKRK